MSAEINVERLIQRWVKQIEDWRGEADVIRAQGHGAGYACLRDGWADTLQERLDELLYALKQEPIDAPQAIDSPQAIDDWLNPIVKRSVDKTIERFARGREHIVTGRSKEIITDVVYNAVINVLEEICTIGFKKL